MSTKRTRTWLIAAALATVSGGGIPDAFGQSEQAIEELFQTETVFPQDAGEIQFTLFPVYASGREGTTKAAIVAFEYGITDSFQIEVEWASYVRIDPADSETGSAHGIGDLEIGGRYSWMNIAGSNFHAALGLDVTIPTGNEEKGLGEGHFGLSPTLILAADVPSLPGAQVVANFGSDVGEGGFAFDEAEWFANFAFFVPIRALTLTTELNLSKHESYFTPGLIWHPAESLELGVGIPIGLTADADDYRVLLMVTWEFDTD